jgi:hypothetical protein
MARARRVRRQLLAAVGGGIRAVVAEGLRTWLFLGATVSLASVLALPTASILLPIAMDPVLDVCLPLGPVAFAVAGLRAPDRPTFRDTRSGAW